MLLFSALITSPHPFSAVEAEVRHAGQPGISFHVHKLKGNAQGPALFTITIWEGTVLRGIWYAQPLNAALAAFREVLEEWGREAMGEEVCRHSGMR